MKAILVIDVPTEMINDDTCITITSINSGMSFNAKLKPMPKKKEIHLDFNEVIWDDETFEIRKLGYNKCINEILGEEE